MTRLDDLRAEVRRCTRCELYEGATQAVFGDGLVKSEVMFVGEQPGDREDRDGHPFVGPAGRVLDRALEAAGIDRAARLRDATRVKRTLRAATEQLRRPEPRSAWRRALTSPLGERDGPLSRPSWSDLRVVQEALTASPAGEVPRA